MTSEDTSSASRNLLDLRAEAVSMFVAGRYDECEPAYRQMIEEGFELASTHIHIARLFLMTDRIQEAAREVELAWRHRHSAPHYVLPRIHFLRMLIALIEGRGIRSQLVEIREALRVSRGSLSWTMEPLLERLRSEIGTEEWVMVVALALAEVLSCGAGLRGVETLPGWRGGFWWMRRDSAHSSS